MDAGFAERYLGYRLGAPVRVVSLRRSFPGISRETWLVRCEVERAGGVAEEGYVFRMDTPGGSIVPLPLKREWDVYERLARSDVPVATPLWYEDDPHWLASGERPFFVRAMAEGTTQPEGFAAPGADGDAARRAAAEAMGEALALVHTADWEALGFADILEVPPSVETTARFDLDLWDGIWREHRPEPMPALARAIAWLRDNTPPPAARLALLKGNNGIGEEIWQGTRIVAMSDWELAHIGDPAEDFAWIQGFDDPALREVIMARYRECSGIDIRPESLHYYAIFRALKATISLQCGVNMFIAHGDLRVQLPSLSLMTYRSQAFLAQLAGI